MQKKDFLRELQKSLTYIENSLTTSISFEGTASNLLIDELQFLLNCGCVAIDSPGGDFAHQSGGGNSLPHSLQKRARTLGWPGTCCQRTSLGKCPNTSR